MRKYSIQPGQGFGAQVRRALLLGAMALTQSAGAAQPPSPPAAKGPFAGTWAIQWCDTSRPTVDCGGFTVDLLQRGSRICGSHGAATAGLTRVDEGNGRSILGTVVGSTAVLTVRSGRSGAIALVTIKRQRGALQWTRTEEIEEGSSGEDLIAVNAVLKPVKPSESAKQQFEATRSSCNAYWDASR